MAAVVSSPAACPEPPLQDSGADPVDTTSSAPWVTKLLTDYLIPRVRSDQFAPVSFIHECDVYGPYWRALRRVASAHLFAPRQVDAFAPYRARVAEDVVAALRHAGNGNGVVNVRGVLRRASLYYIMRFVFGKEYDVSSSMPASGKKEKDQREVEELLEMVHEGYELVGKENWCDYFPGLAALDPQGVRARCAELMPRVNRFVHGIIDEHRGKAMIAGGEGEAQPLDFVDILLSLQESEGLADANIDAVLWHCSRRRCA